MTYFRETSVIAHFPKFKRMNQGAHQTWRMANETDFKNYRHRIGIFSSCNAKRGTPTFSARHDETRTTGAHVLRCGGVLVFDVTSSASFKDIRGWIQEARSSGVNIQKGGNVFFALCGNKIDLPGRQVWLFPSGSCSDARTTRKEWPTLQISICLWTPWERAADPNHQH